MAARRSRRAPAVRELEWKKALLAAGHPVDEFGHPRPTA